MLSQWKNQMHELHNRTYLWYRTPPQSLQADCLRPNICYWSIPTVVLMWSSTIGQEYGVVINVFMAFAFSSLVFWLRNA